MTANEFYNKTIGKSFDIDKSAGVQCVDLFKYFCQLMNGTYLATGTGYASGYYTKRATNGILKYFKDMGSNPSVLKNGDWVIWGYGTAIAPKSHIAMYYNGKFLGQNQGGAKKTTLISMSTSGVIGILRPNQYVTTTSSSNIKYTTSDLNVRTGAGTNYNAVNVLYKKTAVRVHEIKGSWARIEEGMWVSNNYLTSTQPSGHIKSMEVTNCSSLNVRKTPNGTIVKTIPNHCVVSVLETNGNWIRIGSNQWVYKQYLK